VVSSKAEFIIDFLILINLEVLFLFYNKPGFEEAGILKLDEFKDFKDYQSKIYYKN